VSNRAAGQEILSTLEAEVRFSLSATSDLAEFCSNIRYEKLPTEVKGKANEMVLDHFGVALYGSTLPSGQIGIEYVRSLGGAAESSVLGARIRAPAPDAALSNGISVHSPELDDTEHIGSIHPGASVIPAALATAEKVHGGGRQFVAAIVAGYDVAIRLAVAAQGKTMSHYNRGFHPTATCGTFAAAASAGIMLGLNASQFKNAFGIAGSAAAGLLEFLEDGSWAKRYGAGRAASSGVTAAYLAKLGFTGPGTVIEGRRGFLRAYSDDTNPEAITAGLGSEFTIMRTGIKPHSCCRYIQAPLDATLEILRKNTVKPEEIEHVEVRLVKTGIKLLEEPSAVKYNPKTVVDAQFSIPYSIATAIVNKRAFVDEYTDSAIKDPRVLSLAKRVKAVHGPELETEFPKHWPAKVSVTLKNGKKLEAYVSGARGDADLPLTREELEEKFSTLAARTITSDSSLSLIEALRRIEDLGDLNQLTAKLEYRTEMLASVRTS
jgi:2-methylcitrate dehydratase PrpD